MNKISLSFLIWAFCFLSASQAQTYERYKHLLDTAIHSSNLDYQKKISITVPAEYQKGIDFQFPLIIVFDLHLERMQEYTLRSIDYLTSTLSMPSAIVIGVESGEGMKRYYETQFLASDPKARGEKNEAFLFDELIPFAQENLKASDFVLVIGHSRYGYFTTYLFGKRMAELNGVISMSPFFTQKNVNLVDSLVAQTRASELAHQVYYRFAIGNDYPEDYALMDSALTNGYLQNQNLNIEGKLYPQAFHNGTPGLLIAGALYDVFEFWAQNQNHFFPYGKSDISIIPQLQDSIAQHYGKPLPFSMIALNGKGWEFYGEGHYEKAIAIWRVLLSQYPNLAEFYLYIASAQKEMKLPFDEALNQFYEQMTGSTAYNDEERLELEGEAKNLEMDNEKQ